jgi:thiol-disulfide isomerase/thioredoxin
MAADFATDTDMPFDPVRGGKVEEARKALRERPVLVLFYMIGCSHCERNQPAWDKMEKKMRGKMKTVKIESADVPPETGVTSFPTMKYFPKKGKAKTLAGAQESANAILGGLGVKSGGTRRSSRRQRHSTRRKIR